MGDVPVPEALRRLSLHADFWSALLLTDDVGMPADADLPDELRLTFPVAGGWGLVLDLDLKRREQTLGLRGPTTAEPVQLGWAAPDQAYPAVLRFAELELCARVIALDDPDLPHPGLVVALLSPFAPAGADDDPAEVDAVREAAYRSLRRDVAPVEHAGPEQAPLPLFADHRWWPAPPTPSAQVLSEGRIATFLTAGAVGPEVRGDKRFPSAGLAELVREARSRLAKLPQAPWYEPSLTLPLARGIADSGDLTSVNRLLGVLTEAGCDHPTVLDALSEPLVPIEACWMVETLAGAEPGTLLRHHLAGTSRLG
jgi:hypothetical protein